MFRYPPILLAASAFPTFSAYAAPAASTFDTGTLSNAKQVGLIGQGAPTDVSAFLRPLPRPGRHYALTTEIDGGPAGQPRGDKVAIAGFAESGPSGSDIWGSNFLTDWRANDPDVNVQGIEVDFNNQNRDATHNEAKMKVGINVTSGGTRQPGYAVMIGNTRSSNAWRQGLVIQDAAVSDTGIAVGAPALSGSIVARQIRADGDTLLLQRRSDTAVGGDLIRGVNAANSQSLFRIMANGHWQIGDAEAPSVLHVSGQSSGRFQALSIENTSPAATQKSIGQSFYGRDTKGRQKLVATLDTASLDADWKDAAIILYAISGNQLVPVVQISGKGLSPIAKDSSLGSDSHAYQHIYAKNIKLTNLPIFENNQEASSGNLEPGEVYRTRSGQIMVKY